MPRFVKGNIPWMKGKKHTKGARIKMRVGWQLFKPSKNRNKPDNWKYLRKLRRKERRKIDPKYRLDCNMSCLISICLSGKKAGKKWQDLVGYKIEDLINHIEKQFDTKMNWDNYGSYWWIDHIKPRSLFNYENPEDEEFKKCWSLKNLQPLEKTENMRKSNKFSKGQYLKVGKVKKLKK